MQYQDLRFKTFFPALLAGGVLSLSACGGSGDSAASTSPDADPTHSAPRAEARSNVVDGPLDPLQASSEVLIIDAFGASLPDPLGGTVSCLSAALTSLVDAPDALLAAASEVPDGGDPAAALQGAAGDFSASLSRFAVELQAALLALTNNGACSSGADPLAGNPLAGTPLEPVVSALQALLAQLARAAEPGDEDPDLTGLTNTLGPALLMLSGSFDQIPAEVRAAPVVGGLVTTLQDATLDLALAMPSIGTYDAAGTQASLEVLINNLLSNVLLKVLPVAEIDAATGQDFSAQIQAGIDQASAALGDGLGQVITPLFDEALNGALEPVLDPVEGLLAKLLGGGISLPGEMIPVGGNPLDGLLGDIAGNGAGSPLDVLLGLLTAGAGNVPLADLVATINGSAAAGSPLDGLTAMLGNLALLDQVLGQLGNTSAGGVPLSGLLDELLDNDDVLGGLLGG